MSTVYQKIPNAFVFDPQTRTFSNTPATPEIALLWDQPIWHFTEKVDGTNVRVLWDGYRVSFAGRSENAQLPPTLLQHLEAAFGGPDNEKMFEQAFGVPTDNVVLYGEGYGPKIQGGHVYRSDVSFVLFDVRVGSLYLSTENVADVARQLGDIDVVPARWDHPVSIETAVAAVADGLPSLWRTGTDTHLAEGVVGKTTLGLLDRRGERLIVKVKARDIAKMSR